MNDTETASEPLIEAHDVTRSYGGVAVLQDASVAFSPGLTVVIGPNGSGKSTLLGTLVGRIPPVSGEVRRHGPAVDGRVGYLPQDVPFRDTFTARETVAFYGRLIGAGNEVDDALAGVGLADAGDRRVDALSGGMRRLLGIAVATLGDPPVVVLDEPTSGLDPGMRERAFAAAGERAGEGTAVVVSTHDLELAGTYADHVVALHRGRVAAAGPIERLLADHGADDLTGVYRSIVGATPVREGPSSATDEGADADSPPADEDAEPEPTNGEDDTAVHVPGVSDR
ncbi:ABC transporter ATP-binding protein [Halorubrum vacuolatum]|nr:ABC transporter ATP-binding protein [Halorubrum vacuolatum]